MIKQQLIVIQKVSRESFCNWNMCVSLIGSICGQAFCKQRDGLHACVYVFKDLLGQSFASSWNKQKNWTINKKQQTDDETENSNQISTGD